MFPYGTREKYFTDKKRISFSSQSQTVSFSVQVEQVKFVYSHALFLVISSNSKMSIGLSAEALYFYQRVRD